MFPKRINNFSSVHQFQLLETNLGLYIWYSQLWEMGAETFFQKKKPQTLKAVQYMHFVHLCMLVCLLIKKNTNTFMQFKV